MLRIITFTIVLAVTTILVGCSEYFLKPYGQVASDAKGVSVGIVILPDGAPTIALGFNPNPSGNGGLPSVDGHEGIDIYAPTGTPVLAPASGVVLDSSYGPFYGNKVSIEHTMDEDGESIKSRLLHLDTRLVKMGDMVIRGQQVGTLGSSGFNASYPHLHFEIRVKDDSGRRITTPMNPHKYWFGGVAKVTCFDREKVYPEMPFRITYPVPCK